MTYLRRNLLPLVILLILPIFMLHPALLPGKDLLPAAMLGKMLPWQGSAAFPTNPPWNPLLFDGIAQFYPWRLFAAQSYRSGYLPLWNPYQFCGTPLLANDQSATLYPLNIVFWIMPVAKAFAASVILHLFLTGAFLYAFLRRRLSVEASLLGAIIWQLSAWQISWLALPTFLCTSAWIPLALLQVERCVECPVVGRGLALGLILGVMLLAGHLQIALYGLLITAAYGITLLIGETAQPDRKQLAWSFAAAAGIMLLICAPQLLPTLELSRVSHRAGAHATLTGYAGYVQLAMPWMRLATLFAPSFFGRSTDYWGGSLIPYPETACFVSIAGLMLVWVGVVGLWRGAGPERIRVRFFAITAALALLFALGTPLNLLTYFGIPGFAATGSPARILSLWTLSLAVLAAFGLDMLRERTLTRPAAWLTCASLVLPLVATILYVETQAPDLLRLVNRADLVASIVLLALAIGIAKMVKSGNAPRYVIPALILLAVVDLFRAGFGFNLVADDAQVYPATPSIAWLQQHAGLQRIVVVNATNAVYEQVPGVLPPNAATVYGLRDLQGYDSLQTGQYKAFLDTLDGGKECSPPENGNMDLSHFEAVQSPITAAVASAQWIVSPVALGPAAGQPLATDNGGVVVYAQPNGSSPRVRTQAGVAAGTAAEIVEDLPTRLTVRTRAAGDLVIADQMYPGWRAEVNGQSAPVLERPYVFRTVPDVPAGATVRLTFEPSSVRVGLYLLDAGVLLVAMSGAAAVVSRRRAAQA